MSLIDQIADLMHLIICSLMKLVHRGIAKSLICMDIQPNTKDLAGVLYMCWSTLYPGVLCVALKRKFDYW